MRLAFVFSDHVFPSFQDGYESDNLNCHYHCTYSFDFCCYLQQVPLNILLSFSAFFVGGPGVFILDVSLVIIIVLSHIYIFTVCRAKDHRILGTGCPQLCTALTYKDNSTVEGPVKPDLAPPRIYAGHSGFRPSLVRLVLRAEDDSQAASFADGANLAAAR